MKISLCVPTYRRPENLNNLLSNILGFRSKYLISDIMIGITGDMNDSINYSTKHILRALEIEEMNVKIKSDFSGLLDAKVWFKNYSDSDILLFLDDDAIITDSYLDLAKHFECPNVGAVSGSLQTPLDIGYYNEYSYDRISTPDEDILCNKLTKNSEGMLSVTNKYQVYMLDKPKVFECECLIGTALFVRKTLLDIDMNYEIGACNFEEIDFTYNMYVKGYKLLFDSSRVAYHLHSNTGGMRSVGSKRKEINSNYFLEKFEDYGIR